MTYRSMLTSESVKSYIVRLKKEEGETAFCKRLIQDFLDLTKKIDIRISDGTRCERVNVNGTINSYVQYHVIIVTRKGEETKASFVINEHSNSDLPHHDLSDILLQIRIKLSSGYRPKDFKEYFKVSGKSIHGSASKTDYQKEVKTASDLRKIFSEKEMACLPTSSSMSDKIEKSLIFIEDITDYDRLIDLREQHDYYGKLISRYGYDLSTGELDTKLVPVTKTDSQVEGMESDIDEYNKRSEAYNEFLHYVVKKYNKGAFDEHEKYRFALPELKKNAKNRKPRKQ